MEEVVECLYNKECNGKVVIDDTLKAAMMHTMNSMVQNIKDGSCDG